MNHAWDTFPTWKTVRELLWLFVRSSKFEAIASALIIASIATLGLEAHFLATHPGQASVYIGANWVFDACFLFEFLLRGVAYGRDFLSEVEWRWNIADGFTLLVCAFADLSEFLCLGENEALTHEISIARFLLVARVARVTRTAQLFKGLQSTNEFQKMAIALLSSAKTLVWSMAILSFVMYFFSLVFCHAVAHARAAGTATAHELALLEDYFGTLPKSLLTVFISITDGLSWHVAFDTLKVLHWQYPVLFIVYITIVQFGVLNVVTAVFVESAIMSAQRYKHLIIQANENERQTAMRHLRQVFKYVDEDNSGEISSEEMEHFWDDPSLRQYISALDIDVGDAWTLFRLLDKDASGLVDIDEFCEGCLRLKGEAKSTDMQLMMFEMQAFLDRWSDFTVYVEECFTCLNAHVGSEALRRASGCASAASAQFASPKS